MPYDQQLQLIRKADREALKQLGIFREEYNHKLLIRRTDGPLLKRLGFFRNEFNKTQPLLEITTDNIHINKGYIHNVVPLFILIPMLIFFWDVLEKPNKRQEELPLSLYFVMAGLILSYISDKFIRSEYFLDRIFHHNQPLDSFINSAKKEEFRINALRYLQSRIKLLESVGDLKLQTELLRDLHLGLSQCRLLVDCYESLDKNNPILPAATLMIDAAMINSSLDAGSHYERLVKEFEKARTRFGMKRPLHPLLKDYETPVQLPCGQSDLVFDAFNQLSYDIALKISDIFKQIYDTKVYSLPIVLHQIIIGYYDDYTYLLEKFKIIIKQGVNDLPSSENALVVNGVYPFQFMIPYCASGVSKDKLIKDYPKWTFKTEKWIEGYQLEYSDNLGMTRYRSISHFYNERLINSRMRWDYDVALYSSHGIAVVDSMEPTPAQFSYKKDGYKKIYNQNNTYHIIDLPPGKSARIKMAGLTYLLSSVHPQDFNQQRVFKIRNERNIRFKFEGYCAYQKESDLKKNVDQMQEEQHTRTLLY